MQIVIADQSHLGYAQVICDTIEESAKLRGTGIAKRTPEYIAMKINNGNAVIALEGDKFAGFCYIETWGHGKFVANSGLIVHPDFRAKGLAHRSNPGSSNTAEPNFPMPRSLGSRPAWP